MPPVAKSRNVKKGTIPEKFMAFEARISSALNGAEVPRPIRPPFSNSTEFAKSLWRW